MTFMFKFSNQSDWICEVNYGEETRQVNPGDSAEILADSDETLVAIRRLKPPEAGNTPPEGGEPLYSFSAAIEPATGEAPLAATLTLTEDAVHPADSFTVDWGDGSDLETTEERTVAHTYAAAGSYAGTVTATHGELTKKIDLPSVSVTEPVDPPARTTRRR